jgi:hypothetical protein
MKRLHVKHNFRELLETCEVIPIHDEEYAGSSCAHPHTTFIKGRKYRLNGRTIAVIFYYGHSDKSVTESIRMLLIDGVKYHAEQLSPF